MSIRPVLRNRLPRALPNDLDLAANLRDLDQRIGDTHYEVNEVRGEVTSVRTEFYNLQAAVDDALGDGVVTAGERQALQGDLRRLAESRANMYQQYLAVHDNPALTGTPKSNLATAWTDYDNAASALVSAIEAAISETGDSGSTVTQAERDAYEAAATDYPAKLGVLAKRLQQGIDAIKNAGLDSLSLEIDDVRNDLASLDTYVELAYRDGIIEEAEAEALLGDLRRLDANKADVEQQYLIVYANPSLAGTAKVNLATAWTEYGDAHNALISAITTAITADGDGIRRITPEERTAYETATADYATKLGVLAKRLTEAADAAAKGYADSAAEGAAESAPGKSPPTCRIEQPYVIDGQPLQNPAPVTYYGALGTGGVGPLKWHTRYGSTWSSWVTTPLPASSTATRHAVHERLLEIEVMDASGVTGYFSTTIAPKNAIMNSDGSLPLSNVSDTPSHRKIAAAYADTSGRVSGVWSGTAQFDGPTIANGVMRAQDGLDGGGKVKQPVPKAYAAAELPDIDGGTGLIVSVGGRNATDLAAAAAQPGQNLWTRYANREVAWSSTVEPEGIYSTATLAEMGLTPGQIISISAEVKENGNSTSTPRIRVWFRNAIGSRVGSLYESGISGSEWAMQVVEALPVHDLAVSMVVQGLDGQSLGGRIRNRMVVLGRVAKAFAEPPFRRGVDTADDVANGSSKRVTTTSEANAAGRADAAIGSTGALYVPQSETVYVGTQGAGGYIQKTIAFSAPMLHVTSSSWVFELSELRLATMGTGNVQAVGAVPIPIGAELVQISAMVYRAAVGCIAEVAMYRITGSASTPIANVANSTTGWQQVSAPLTDIVTADRRYAVKAVLYSNDTPLYRAAVAWITVTYRVSDYSTAY